jgi:hypothetical protein
MSVRENIELYGLQDTRRLAEVLRSEFGAIEHPRQENAYILENLPLYSPRVIDDHISILSFNNKPLPDSLVEALVKHSELFPDDVLIRWTQEQDLIFEATLGELRGQAARP